MPKRKRENKLVLNSAAPVAEETAAIQNFTVNVSGPVRREKMEGRDHVVVPMVMMVEGVLNGSAGPLLYPADEMAKTPAVWNYKPVVVYHPTMNGRGISACEPTVIDTQKIGVIMNTKFIPGKGDQPAKLKAEAWIESDKARRVDNRVVDAIESNTMMELSTGLFTDNEVTSGDFNGAPYTHIARNYRPDHLAVLPDQIGACSMEDGAGFLRLNSSQVQGLSPEAKEAYSKFLSLLTNQQEEPAEDRAGESETEDGKPIGNGKKEPEMGKEEKVNSIIENTAWEEDDREYLLNMEETRLDKILADSEAPKTNEDEEKSEEEETPAAPAVQNTDDVEEYLKNAPAAVQAMLRDSMAIHNAKKQELIALITANERNTFKADFLATKDVAELEALAALAKPVENAEAEPTGNAAPSAPTGAARFTGQGEVKAPVSNTGHKEEALTMAPMEFGEQG
jgi:hypothetical protein